MRLSEFRYSSEVQLSRFLTDNFGQKLCGSFDNLKSPRFLTNTAAPVISIERKLYVTTFFSHTDWFYAIIKW